MSPITPFMSDKLYTGLNELINKEGLPSIHMESLSDYIGNLKSDSEITRKINSMVDVVISVRGLKAGACIGTRMKSKELILKHPSQEFLDDIKELETELLTAIRVDKITYQILGVDDLTVKINPNHTIGKTCKRDLMTVLDIIKKTPVSELLDKTENKNKNKESIIIMGYTIPGDTWIIIPREQDKEEKESILVDYTNQGLLVQLTKEVITTPLEDQMELMIKNMQKAKKEANLKPYQIADIYLEINTDTEFYRLINEEFDNIKERLRSNLYLNQTNKHMKLDEFTKVIQNVKTELYSYEIWI